MLKKVRTIPEAKREIICEILSNGYIQNIKEGSFEGDDFRVQLPMAAIEITDPLEDRIPVPMTWDWPTEQTLSACVQYFLEYIVAGEMPSEATEHTEYTYGMRMNAFNQLQEVVKKLLRAKETNQAAVVIASPMDAHIKYPACLRDLHFKYFDGKLHMYTHWRSHDMYGGFGMNMVGLSILLEYVASETGLEVGSMFYTSSGSHLYGMALDMVR